MKRFPLLALILLVQAPLAAADKPGQAAPVKLAVLGIVSRATNSSIDASSLTELLQKSLSEKKPFVIVERSVLSNIIAEYRLDLTGLTESDRPKIGTIKEADKLAVGSVSRVGTNYLLIVKILDVRTGVMDLSVTAESPTESGLYALVASLADRIADRAFGGHAPAAETKKLPVTGPALPKDGLVSYFPFTKNARDAGPAKNDGTVQGAVLTNDRWGAPRSAYAIPADFGRITLSGPAAAPAEFTAVVWFATDSRDGGRILGFGDSKYRGGSVSEIKDRHVLMHESGRVSFGVLGAATNQVLITTKNTYNDGTWHCAAAVFSPASGMKLFMDGELEADTNGFTPLVYDGYWRLGYDQLSDWAYQPRLFTLTGMFDDARIYSRALNAEEIAALYRESGWEQP